VPLHVNRGARRLAVASIVAIALHAGVAAFVPAPQTPIDSELVARLTLARIEPRPTPTPSPTPVPQRRQPSAAPIREPASAAPAPSATLLRAPAPHAGSLRPLVRSKAHARPIWDAPAGGTGAGTGSQSGIGGNQGNGTGGGGSGGNGAGGGSQPCGFVTFSDPDGSRYDKATGGFYVDIGMTVHFANGGTSSVVLDYPWYYPNEAANPWSVQNRDNPNFPTTFQQPPPEKRDAEPSLVRYVIAHTSAGGYTLLKDCPPVSPPPS
jgi:hypothetical protein